MQFVEDIEQCHVSTLLIADFNGIVESTKFFHVILGDAHIKSCSCELSVVPKQAFQVTSTEVKCLTLTLKKLVPILFRLWIGWSCP